MATDLDVRTSHDAKNRGATCSNGVSSSRLASTLQFSGNDDVCFETFSTTIGWPGRLPEQYWYDFEQRRSGKGECLL
jgi:hypothetical protein